MRTESDQPSFARVHLNGREVAELPADLMRPGTLKLGIHETGKCGFSKKDPFAGQKLHSGDIIEVFAESSDFQLENSPWEYSFERPKVFFMHVAKAGGTSVNDFFAKHLGNNKCFFHMEGKRNWNPEQMVERHDFISGHVRIQRIRRILKLEGFYLTTVFREPKSHLMSHLSWVKHIADNPKGAFFRSHTPEVQELALLLSEVQLDDAKGLLRFLETMGPEGFTLFDNCQCRYLLEDPPTGKIGEEAWEEMTSSLDLFDRIGLTSDLDSYAEGVARDLHFRPPEKFPRSNVQKGNKPSWGLEVEEVIESYIALDKRMIEHLQSKS